MRKIKLIIAFITVVFLFILLLNGGGDLLISMRSYIHRDEVRFLQSLPDNLDRRTYAKYYVDTRKLKYRHIPYIGNIVVPGSYGIYDIDQSGRRVVQNQIEKKPPTKKLLVLGASQSFGYYNSSDTTLVSYLSALLPDYEIDNYSSPGQTVSQNLENWKRIEHLRKKHYDLAIIVNGTFDYFDECKRVTWVDMQQKNKPVLYKTPALVSIFNMIKTKLWNKSDEFELINLCNTDYYQKMMSEKIFHSFENILHYGSELDTKTFVFIPPALWGNQANISNIKSGLSPEEISSFTKIASMLSKASGTNNHIVDFSHVFDHRPEEFFLDFNAHLIPEGNQILAHEMVRYIKENNYF
ncbi:SGNH/GDSL hydrolase family protein [Vibrio mangrovi]|uniref:SGNH/GDSL hydrolase family protein n=1 Tax=Vibrio mangrovi TaxID=474394 RepID=A0A1Y6ITY0_9VIBR|nr:SGNH/GDSL hydrolase family protein [Vibrio mangrovi]MDW6003270.1 SGNH/GDSL hydrolase family protein [Vibrio mangrovi]SMR99942.1 hypothetical protein VIM7927_01180 [Vibrio mangrovi]